MTSTFDVNLDDYKYGFSVPEIFFNNIGVLAQAGIHIQKDNALFLQVFKNAVVNHFTLILGAHPG